MKGPDVNALMLLLVKYKYLAPENLNSDQLFTVQVQEAIKKFQREKGLEADGVVGPMVILYLKTLGGTG